jgi:hypothetical protein
MSAGRVLLALHIPNQARKAEETKMFAANAYRIRFADGEDGEALTQLAGSGSQRPLDGRVLIGDRIARSCYDRFCAATASRAATASHAPRLPPRVGSGSSTLPRTPASQSQ